MNQEEVWLYDFKNLAVKLFQILEVLENKKT